MAMTLQSAERLIDQLQQAHRISVAFYRRMLPTMDYIATELNCEFRSWEPLHTSMPRKSTRPSTTWAWDYVPLFASNHLYARVHGECAQPSDVGLYLCLYVDQGFAPGERQKHGFSGEPDAVSLPVGKAVLQAWIYRPIVASERSFDELWFSAADPELGVGHVQQVADNVNAIAFEWSLADIICDTGPMLETLKRHTG